MCANGETSCFSKDGLWLSCVFIIFSVSTGAKPGTVAALSTPACSLLAHRSSLPAWSWPELWGCGVTVPSLSQCMLQLLGRQSQFRSISKMHGFNREKKACTGWDLCSHCRAGAWVFPLPCCPNSTTAVPVTCLEVPEQRAGTENAQTPGVRAQAAKRAKPALLLLNHRNLVAPREQPWPPFCKTRKLV